MKALMPLGLLLALTACAPTPLFREVPAVPTPAPRDLARDIERHMDRSVLWGGMVLELREFEGYVEIEVLGFPIDEQARPQPRARDGGRFIALRAGKVDPLEVAPGRFLTLSGRITGERRLSVHGAEETVVEVDAREIHLWPTDWNTRERPRVSVGIGVRGGW
jgi:outer membrane lipoprotein